MGQHKGPPELMNICGPIELFEYTSVEVSRDRLPLEAAALIKQIYSEKLIVETTSFMADSNWKLTSQGWVGFIPLMPEIGLRLLPKPGIPIGNLFRMLEYAYNLESFHLLDKALFDCATIEDFYDRLANILARRIMDRGLNGFYHSYLSDSDHLSYVRGRIDLENASLRPWDVKLKCNFEEHTSDIEDNRILAWTLLQLLRSGLCTERSQPFVSQAYRRLLSFAEPVPCGPEACHGRHYNRLNYDYKPMHALCRLFLEHLGPAYKVGKREMIPFVVDMALLYERFIAEWLSAHPFEGYSLEAQKDMIVDHNQKRTITLDLLLYEEPCHRPKCVMDTKYKVGIPSNSDIYQVVSYAVANGCSDAMLIYPAELERPLDERWGDIRVRSATFSLEGDLEEAGRKFSQEIVEAFG
jgi:5-methylcytosine-specific restriction enzyme subunit McrC